MKRLQASAVFFACIFVFISAPVSAQQAVLGMACSPVPDLENLPEGYWDRPYERDFDEQKKAVQLADKLRRDMGSDGISTITGDVEKSKGGVLLRLMKVLGLNEKKSDAEYFGAEWEAYICTYSCKVNKKIYVLGRIGVQMERDKDDWLRGDNDIYEAVFAAYPLLQVAPDQQEKIFMDNFVSGGHAEWRGNFKTDDMGLPLYYIKHAFRSHDDDDEVEVWEAYGYVPVMDFSEAERSQRRYLAKLLASMFRNHVVDMSPSVLMSWGIGKNRGILGAARPVSELLWSDDLNNRSFIRAKDDEKDTWVKGFEKICTLAGKGVSK